MRYDHPYHTPHACWFAPDPLGGGGGVDDQFVLRPFIEHLLEQARFTPAGTRVLVIGCDTGRLARFLARQGFGVLGVDDSPEAVDAARELAQKQRVPAMFEPADLATLELPADSFDLVIGVCLPGRITGPEERASLLERLHRWLRPGGELWIDTPVAEPARQMMSADDLLAELVAADFDLLWHETRPPAEPGDKPSLQMRCRRPRA
ncbi:MAG: class I SAM-dependent methyltransferase [Phycisphaeraceae bacterium]